MLIAVARRGIKKKKMRAMVNPITEAIFIILEYWNEFLLSDNIYSEAAMACTYAYRNPGYKSRSKYYH